jgi:hypothetical protein
MGTNNTETTPTTAFKNFEVINREDELNAMQEILYRLTTPGRLLPKPILEFNGIGGIGKTVLLRKFWQESKMREGLRSAFIDFHEFFENQQTNLNKLIFDIVQQIGIRNELSTHIEATANTPIITQDLSSSLIEYLRSALQSPQKETPLALIFDSVDEADKNTKEWLISLVDNTVDAGKILFAIASKISLGFSQKSSLEKKIYAFRLKEFNQEFTLRHIQGFLDLDTTENLQNWANAVFRLTQGHPLANEVVVSVANKRRYPPQTISNNQYEFIKILDKEVVREKVFHGYDDEAVNKFRQILTYLSIPRMFNLVSMGKLIGEFAPEYAFKSSWHYSNYIRELQSETSFIRYSREKSAYVVDPILRSVFSLTLKNESPEKFILMHQFLVDMYTEWIQDAKGTDKTKFFIEKIYHQIPLGISSDYLIPQFKEFAEIVVQNIEEERQRDVKQQFIEEFRTDPDVGEFFDELTKSNIQKMFE